MAEENIRSHRTSHPASPNARIAIFAEEAKENNLTKHKGKRSQVLEMNTAKAANRNGKNNTVNNPTIDTLPKGAVRIIEEIKGSEFTARNIPQRSPRNIKKARSGL